MNSANTAFWVQFREIKPQLQQNSVKGFVGYRDSYQIISKKQVKNKFEELIFKTAKVILACLTQIDR